MKPLLYLVFFALILFTNCKSEKKTGSDSKKIEQTVLEKIALANGYENWNRVETLKFTFNVDRDTSHFERHWIWNRKSNEVTGISLGDTATYNRAVIDSTDAKVDAAFINDKFWLLAPLNILWDKDNVSTTHTAKEVAPMSKDSLQKLSVVYGNEGGYTPGDAYDFYFDADYVVREWVFRKDNQAEASMTTSWEDYKTEGGLKIARMHQNKDGSFKLYFTNVTVTTR